MAKFNLSLDDFSPHPRAGLNFECIEWCNKLIDRFCFVKINLFTPTSYCRLGEEPCHLNLHEEWLEKVRGLPEEHYRINLHGIYHRRSAVDYKAHSPKPASNNDEWQFVNEAQASVMAEHMMSAFDRTGIKYHKTFRPPGWKISRGAVKGLQSWGVSCFAGSDEYYHRVKDVLLPETRWISYNWDLTGPCNIEGDIVAYGHTSDWTNNYMDETRYNLICDLLSSGNFEFKFIEDM